MNEKAIILKCGRCGNNIRNTERRFFPWVGFYHHLSSAVYVCELCFDEMTKLKIPMGDCVEVKSINKEE
jgi:hypothetical protein